MLVHNLNEAVYKVADMNVLNLNSKYKRSRIIPNQIHYDLT